MSWSSTWAPAPFHAWRIALKLRLDGEIVLSAEPSSAISIPALKKNVKRAPIIRYSPLSTDSTISRVLQKNKPMRSCRNAYEHRSPERAQTIRLILLELSRIASHSSVARHERARTQYVLRLHVLHGGTGKDFRPLRRDVRSPYVSLLSGASGALQGSESEFEEHCRAFLKKFPATWKDLDNLLTNNYVWCERLQRGRHHR